MTLVDRAHRHPQKKAKVNVMKKRLSSVIPALALSIGLLTASQPAHAEQKSSVVYNTILGSPYCLWETYVLGQNGNNLQVTGYAWGQGYAGGACNGDVAPENTISMDATLAFRATPTAPITWSKPLTPSTNWLYGVWNTTNFFGLYFATIPGAGLLSSGAAGLIIPYTELNGPGYYQIEMSAWIPAAVVGGVQTATGAPVHSDWQYMNIPHR
jgi:hypothetical protein